MLLLVPSRVLCLVLLLSVGINNAYASGLGADELKFTSSRPSKNDLPAKGAYLLPKEHSSLVAGKFSDKPKAVSIDDADFDKTEVKKKIAPKRILSRSKHTEEAHVMEFKNEDSIAKLIVRDILNCKEIELRYQVTEAPFDRRLYLSTPPRSSFLFKDTNGRQIKPISLSSYARIDKIDYTHYIDILKKDAGTVLVSIVPDKISQDELDSAVYITRDFLPDPKYVIAQRTSAPAGAVAKKLSKTRAPKGSSITDTFYG